MKDWGPTLLVIFAFCCYQVGAEVRWAKAQFDEAKAEALQTKQEIDKLARETAKTVERFRVVLDDIAKVFKEMENEAVAIGNGRASGGAAGDVDAKPDTVNSINAAKPGPDDGSFRADQRAVVGSRTTGQVSREMDLPRFD